MLDTVNGIGNGHQNQAKKTVQNKEAALEDLKSFVVKAVNCCCNFSRDLKKYSPSSIPALSRMSTWTMSTSTLPILRPPGAISLGEIDSFLNQFGFKIIVSVNTSIYQTVF